MTLNSSGRISIGTSIYSSTNANIEVELGKSGTTQVSLNDTDARALIQKSWTSHSDPTNGITTLTLSSSDTNRAPGAYFFELQIKDGSGNISTSYSGRLIILSDIINKIT